MEVWSMNSKGKLSCHLFASSVSDANEKIKNLNEVYPERTFIIASNLLVRKVINGKVVKVA